MEHGDWPGAERAWCISKVTEAGDYSHDIAYLSVDSADPIGRQESADAVHIALHDPAFVLAWAAALREVIRIYPRELGRIRPEYRSWVFLPSDSPDRIEQWSRDQEHELLQLVRTWRMEDYLREVCFTPESPTLRALARPFRGRPGWRDEWDTP